MNVEFISHVIHCNKSDNQFKARKILYNSYSAISDSYKCIEQVLVNYIDAAYNRLQSNLHKIQKEKQSYLGYDCVESCKYLRIKYVRFLLYNSYVINERQRVPRKNKNW